MREPLLDPEDRDLEHALLEAGRDVHMSAGLRQRTLAALGVGTAATLGASLVGSYLLLPPAVGRASKGVRLSDLVSRDPRVNWLSASRLFLFGARDIWFVLALPIFLTAVLGWAHAEVGGFLALWVMGYGFVQASAPAYVGGGRDTGGPPPPTARTLRLWTLALVLPLGGIVGALAAGLHPAATLVVGLVAFAVVFATNSAIHSYLIVSYADADKVSLSVGFYYMANAAGRLTGTVLSGALFQAAGQGLDGLLACLTGSILFIAASAVLCWPLISAERNMRTAAERLPSAVAP